MAFRNLIIQSRAFVRSSNNKINLKGDEDKSLELPFEDIGSIVLDSPEITITSSTLSKIAENNCAMFITNSSHLPIGVLLSFNNHSHQVKQIKKQINISDSFNKRLWQIIIKAKVLNQSEVLLRFGKIENSNILKTLADRVLLDDKSNKESYASSIYFKSLFDSKFTRSNLCTINSALNYGFAIIRGNIARHLVSFGLIPSIGIHHKNEYNNFNLADDLIEPYRPFVEYFVKMYITEDYSPILKRSDRNSLFDILNMQVKFGDKKFSLESSIEQMVKSLITSINESDPTLFIYPEILDVKRKFYD